MGEFLVDAQWAEILQPVRGKIDALVQQPECLPAQEDILRVFDEPFSEIKVVIVGQDPYPTPGHAMGLAFSTAPGVRPLPKSLINIFEEYSNDLHLPVPQDGDLSPWSRQGVALMNRVLTVSPGNAGSHRNRGWEEITEFALRALAARQAPLVAILWGKDAQATQRFLGDTPCICSPHPSPLSAYRGFFGSRPFSRANELLVGLGASPVDWRL
ncbi:uracil-DNA glycosylase [Corynebacterium sp.]|uniref:uracil-DNA glycosylase n=1 Tax=Corynebacterium sp. TaxID=1720 RepID=UPI0026DCD8B6|nr:uracil-DNA glycosylase [Corynebacterium sp.]MDO5077970.1 uracil-DNA glycosylase [Corynebacterium sp.]